MGNSCVQETSATSIPLEEMAEEKSEDDEDIVIFGPVENVVIPNLSVGEFIYKSLKEMPPDMEIMIESDTGVTMTAKEMLEVLAGVATSLREKGVKKSDRIAVIAINSIDSNVATVAALMVGAVFCPIDSSLKAYELKHSLGLLNPCLIFCDADVILTVEEALKGLGKDVPIYAIHSNDTVYVPTLESLYQDVPITQFHAEHCEKNDPLVIVFSSGTTGLPKGVEISHYSINYQSTKFMELWPRGRILQCSYMYWISGVQFLLGGLIGKYPRVLVKTNDPIDCLRAFDKYKPFGSFFPPSLLNGMLNHPQFNEFDLSSFKMVGYGGSPMPKSTFDKLRECFPEIPAFQGYGATELVGVLTATGPGVDPLSLGKLIANVKCKIVDVNTGKSLGPEQEGEIWAQTPTVMLGYYQNEAATKACLDENGWYHTGDIGKYTKDGVFYLTGRIKELMKVDNHQISPVEIEEVIAQLKGVHEVAVVGINEGPNTLPLALVVREPDSGVTSRDVIRIVEENLSEFKQLRGGVFFVDALMRTNTGKLRRIDVQKLGQELYDNMH